MKTSISDFNESTCKLYKPVLIFFAIHAATNGDPCTTGCAYFDQGRCVGYQDTINGKKTTRCSKAVFTNADIAKELCCSTRQISKRRKNGTLPKKFI